MRNIAIFFTFVLLFSLTSCAPKDGEMWVKVINKPEAKESIGDCSKILGWYRIPIFSPKLYRDMDKGAITDVKLPSSLSKIGDAAFNSFYRLTNIEIPSSVTEIGDDAFGFCKCLTSIEIPSSVTEIGCGVFYGCTSLTSIVVDINNQRYDSRENCNAIINTSTNVLEAGCRTTIIPPSVTGIRSKAFEYCSGLTSIELPSGVTSIGDQAFYFCRDLTSIEIPSSVTEIGCEAFYGCSSLTSIEIPSGVTSIRDKAFCGCSSLTSINIPSGVTYFDYDAFQYCSSLESIYVNAIIPPEFTYFDISWQGGEPAATFYVPKESLDAYKNAEGWQKFAYRILGY